MIQFHRYSAIDADRQAAIDARMYLWGRIPEKEILERLPKELPKNWFYRQEIVCCLGRHLAFKKYDIDEKEWDLCRGLVHYRDSIYADNPDNRELYYQPRNSGLFSVIENIIVADFYATQLNHNLVIVGDGNWWNYDEEFSAIFPYKVKYGVKPNIDFEAMRNNIFNADLTTINQFYTFKKHSYQNILRHVFKVVDCGDVTGSCLFFFRGGDKLLTETILPPDDILLYDIRAASRRHKLTYLLSDDGELAKKISDMDDSIISLVMDKKQGYHHVPGQKISCLPILQNYVMLATCEESISCPSANLVNAAHWSRDTEFIYPTFNPVYRYALI
jgi:hypothetical protein